MFRITWKEQGVPMQVVKFADKRETDMFVDFLMTRSNAIPECISVQQLENGRYHDSFFRRKTSCSCDRTATLEYVGISKN